jgi:hypothetical protein
MDRWATRGRTILIIIFVLMGITYLGERIVYHGIAGFSGLLPNLIVTALLLALGFLVYRGHRVFRWIMALLFLLNGLGTPAGLGESVGPAMAQLIGLIQLVAHLLCAVALCVAPGIPAFLRAQRARRKPQT